MLVSETYSLNEKYIAKSLNYFKLLMNCTVAVQQTFRGESSFPHFLVTWSTYHLLLFI